MSRRVERDMSGRTRTDMSALRGRRRRRRVADAKGTGCVRGRTEGEGRNQTRTHRYMWAASRRPPRPSRIKFSFPAPRSGEPAHRRIKLLVIEVSLMEDLYLRASIQPTPLMQRVLSPGLARRGTTCSASPRTSKDPDRTREAPARCLRIVSEREMSLTHQFRAYDRLMSRRTCPRDSPSARAYSVVLLLIYS